MDKEQIRENLAGYRPEFYDDDDPLIAESLKAARADPELSSWLEEQIKFDRKFSALTSLTRPPVGSREVLLEAYRKPSQVEGSHRHKSSLRVTWAAVALLLFSAAGLTRFVLFPAPVEFTETTNPTVETFREQMAFFASQRFVLDERFKNNSESAAWLAGEDFPTLGEIPGELIRYQGMGCKKISWQNRRVGLICFRNEANEIVHLFILDRENLTATPQPDSELGQVLIRHQRETKGWCDDAQVYLLVGSEPGVKVGGLITIHM